MAVVEQTVNRLRRLGLADDMGAEHVRHGRCRGGRDRARPQPLRVGVWGSTKPAGGCCRFAEAEPVLVDAIAAINFIEKPNSILQQRRNSAILAMARVYV